KALRSAYIRHLYGQGQGVIRTRKHAVLAHRNLVEVNSWRRWVETHRFGITEKINLVITRRELHPQRCRENAASADQWETGNANSQRSLLHQFSVYALSDSEMSIRRTNVMPGASAWFKYSCSPAPAT